MKYHLVVTEPFGTYKRGQVVTDAKEIKKIEAENPGEVVRVAVKE